MISDYKLFQVLYAPHVSEKSTVFFKKNNIIILKVAVKSTKYDIKCAVRKLFSVEVKSINTIIMKGKLKKKGKFNIRRNHWKKAYVQLYAGQNLDFINNVV